MDNQSANLGDNLLRFNKEQKFLFYDTETCNLNLASRKNVPWEYAWVLATKDKVLVEKEYLVQWPEIPISKAAAEMTGFYRKQHRIATHGAKPEVVLQEFEELLYDPTVIPVAHNGLGFDVYMHNTHRLNCGKQSDYSYIDRYLDTHLLSKALKMGVPVPQSNRLAWQYRLSSHRERGLKTSIKAMCLHYNIEYDEAQAHDALYDVRLMRQIFGKLLYDIEL